MVYEACKGWVQVGNFVLQKLMSEGALRQKDLTCTRKGNPISVQYHELGTGLAEACFIVDEIKRLHNGGCKYDDIAVLCRLNNNRFLFNHEFGVLHHIKMQLAKEAVPHRVFRGRQCAFPCDEYRTTCVLCARMVTWLGAG